MSWPKVVIFGLYVASIGGTAIALVLTGHPWLALLPLALLALGVTIE
jgi:hypothetical protein